MQIPILSGIGKSLRRSYPVNMIPVPVPTGISNGYFRPADGIVEFATGPGLDRGGIDWRGVHYRVMGTSLVRVTEAGVVVPIGSIPGYRRVTFDYSFDVLAISADGRLYYYDGTTLEAVTDSDLGTCLDVVWVDGYFMSTDGTFLIVTELTDPTQVSPLKYGSSEADPDPVVALVKIRNEVYAVNRYTTEVFDNIGGEFFPFARIEGAQIQKGAVGTHAACVYLDTLAFVGSGRNESPAVYLGANASVSKVSTREIDQILLEYTDDELSGILLESRNDRANQFLYLHLPDRTLVYDAAASQQVGEPVWFVLTSAVDGFEQYRAKGIVWSYGKWISGDTSSNKLGYFTDDISSHYGDKVRWEFQTDIIYNNSRGALFHELELVALTGNVAISKNPLISTSYSVDGVTWSQPKARRVGIIGDRRKRLVWYQQGHMRTWRIQRFQGDSDSHITVARLEAQLEPLGA